MSIELIPEEDVFQPGSLQLVSVVDVLIKQPKKRISGDGIWRRIRKRVYNNTSFNNETIIRKRERFINEQKSYSKPLKKLSLEIGIVGCQSSKLLRSKYPTERIKTIKFKDYATMSQL